MKYEAILLAAGSGTRMNSLTNKVLLELDGKAVVRYSIDLFLQDDDCEHLILVAKEEELSEIENLLPETKKKISLVIGGSERQHSVSNGLKALMSSKSAVMVHDAARPLLTIDLLKKLSKALETSEAALLGVPVKDTIKQVNDSLVEGTVPRENLYAAQTPQMVRGSIFLQAHKEARENDFLGTDDISLVEEYFPDVRIEMVLGSDENIKLTTPTDWLTGVAILKGRNHVL